MLTSLSSESSSFSGGAGFGGFAVAPANAARLVVESELEPPQPAPQATVAMKSTPTIRMRILGSEAVWRSRVNGA